MSVMNLKLIFMVYLVLQVEVVIGFGCIQKERQALLLFKDGLDDSFGMLSSWTTPDCCQWKGITCTNLTGHILMLNLTGDSPFFYLSGKIHNSLMELQQLQYLNLSHNEFRGSHIPDFFGSLNSLRYLDLSYSLFGGKIPCGFEALSHLKYLDLHGNFLEGSIPSQLGNVSNLQFLDLRYNALDGTIPSQLGKLSKLQELYLSGSLKIKEENHDGGQWLSNLTSLTHLYLDSIYDLDHTSLQMIGKLPKLRELSLPYCSLSDHFSSMIVHLVTNFSSNLVGLDLSGNNLTVSPPSNIIGSEMIAKLPKLKTLRLSQCSLLDKFLLPITPSSFNFSTTSLSILDLSRNNFSSMIFNWISNFSSNLVKLDLSGNDLTVSPPSNLIGSEMIAKLPKLKTLRLSQCSLSDNFLLPRTPSNFNFSTTSLSILDLSDNNFSSMIFNWVSNFSSNLVELDLSVNMLQDTPSSNDFGRVMNSLERLYLSNNRLKGGVMKSLMNICTLRSLELHRNNLTEGLPSILHDLSSGCVRYSLQYLMLGYNQITGSLPDLSMFLSLKNLDLDGNKLSGMVPEGRLPSQLEALSIHSNSLEGGIPKSFGINACALQWLDLGNNSLSEELPVLIHHLSGCARFSLKQLDLSTNQINGTLPILSLFSSLTSLDLSGNSLKGRASDAHFNNMPKLVSLLLSGNSLALTFTKNWVPHFQLQYVQLSSCKLGPTFPKWLQTQNRIKILDISNVGISDIVPKWFWDILVSQRSLQEAEYMRIDISHNNLQGIIPNIPMQIYCDFLSLASNQFEGPIPPFLLGSSYLDLSNNKFSGSLSFLCANGTVKTLYRLDLSDNHLSGQIPDCWNNFKSMAYLNLSHNNIFGKVPTSMGSLLELQVLVLRNNNLTEEIPSSLRSCTKLVMLDAGENRLSGHIPSWIGSQLQKLQVLSLGRNRFFGSLPLQLCNLDKVQVFDLSLNNLSGPVPKCFKNFTSMAQETSSRDYSYHAYIFNTSLGETTQQYDLNAFLVWKGFEQMFQNDGLSLLKSIDLSSNHLSGEIPTEIEDLFGLVSLNLSRNNFTGEIPSNIGKLQSLESLDLSRNQFLGSIPSSLAQIDRLEVLDVSHNHLSGQIPTGTQLQSFNASYYEDNLDLCGPPLQKLCIKGDPAQEPNLKYHEDEDLFFTRGFYLSMAFGFIIGFWGVFGSIIIKRSWRHAYFRFLNNLTDDIYVLVTVNFAKCKRWSQASSPQ